MRTRWRSGFARLMVIGLLGVLVPTASIQAAPAAEIEGYTYTSPTFGYRVTWDDSWFVVAEEVDAGSDYLTLTNGTTVATFAGAPDGASPETAIGYLVAGLGAYGGLDNAEPLIGSDGLAIRGGDGDDHAYAALTGTTTFDDGTTAWLAVYLDCRPIVPGASLLCLFAFMPVETFGGQLPRLEGLLAGVVLPGAEAEDAEANLGADVEPGEPAPVFVAQRWRVAVATTVRDRAIEAAGLEPKSDKDWIVVVADVTNWSADDAAFVDSDLGLVFAGGDRRYKVAPNSSRAVGRVLGLAASDFEAGIPIAAGATVRLALVFLIPTEGQTPTLHGLTGEPGLPLGDGRGAADLLAVRPTAEPPALEEVEVVEAIDGEVVELRIAGAPERVRARLIGVDAPAAGACYADWATSVLTSLVSETVWIERDPTEASGLTEKVYLWAEDRRGMRVLINVQQVADGYAEPRPLAEEARFAAWLDEASRTARANRTGLWGRCEQAEPAEAASAVATRTPAPEPLASEVTIEVYDLGYRPEQVTIPAETDVTLTVVNAGAAEHTFTIDELDVSIAIPPGETETFILDVPAGEYVFYCERPGHRASGMEGVLRSSATGAT